MAYPDRRTVWYVRRTNAVCPQYGKRYGKELIIVGPPTFSQFWDLWEIVRDEKAGYGGLCWRCALEWHENYQRELKKLR
jgi:hypothetical protein